MLFKNKIFPAALGAIVSLGLVACGSDSTSTVGVGGATTADTGSGTTGSGTTGGTPTGSSASDARTIVLSYPYESVENLENGFYRRQGAAIVTDNEGNPVPDGTDVYLNLIDSIIAKGTISSDAGDSIVDNVLTDNNPTLADGTATPLDSAYVTRNEAQYYIREYDHLFLKKDVSSFGANSLLNAEPGDKNRIIDSFTANTITVKQNYSVDYPNSNYGSGVTDYIVGASLLGAEVQGVEFDTDGNEVLINDGKSITKGGVAKFYVTYPANRREINTGCISSEIDDTRSLPLGSADVVLVASAGSEAITLDDRFCFTPMAPFTLIHEPDFSLAAGNSGSWTATVTLEDATRIRVPFEEVWAYATVDNAGLSITSITFSGGGDEGVTNTSGQTQVTVTATATAANEATGEEGAKGATGTITVRAGDASTEITLTVF